MSITIPQLEYFLKTAELQSITKAAEELHLMQPSLSRSINSLETSLGVELFDRVGRNVILNRNGEIVATYAANILSQLKAMNDELKDSASGSDHTISIILSAASTYLPGLLRLFTKHNPNVRFIINQQNVNALNFDGDLHLFSSSTPIDNDYTVTLLEENLLLAIPNTNDKAKQQTINLSSFKDANFITLQQGKGLRTLTDYYCQMANFVPKIALESDSPYTVREYIKAGLGVAFVPEITWAEVRGSTISLMPIRSPKCKRYICLSWNPNGYLSVDAKNFRDFLIKHFETYAKDKAEKAIKKMNHD